MVKAPEMSLHKTNEEYLIDRQPVSNVGVVWSQQNMDFYGRDATEQLVELPWRGITQALIRSRIPFLPVHADHIERDAKKLSLLILPNLGVMTDDQVASVRRYVAGGGNLLANIIRWTSNDDFPLSVDGPGLIDCHIYRQEERLVLHFVNLTNAGTWRQPVDELIPVGPLSIRVRIPEGIAGNDINLLVSGKKLTSVINEGWSRFEINAVLDHEVAVIH
jgi:hypothetical protein